MKCQLCKREGETRIGLCIDCLADELTIRKNNDKAREKALDDCFKRSRQITEAIFYARTNVF